MRDSALEKNAAVDPVYYMREGVEERWTPVRASMTKPGFAGTLDAAKKMARASAFWSQSPLYVGQLDVSGSIKIVSLMRWRERETGDWLDGKQAEKFEIDGKL